MCIFGCVRGCRSLPAPSPPPSAPRHPLPYPLIVLWHLKPVQVPAVKNARRTLWAARLLSARDVWRCEFVAKLLSESQLVVVVLQLRRLHEAANLRSPVQVCLLLGSIFFLLLHLVQLGVISSILLHGNEEVTQVQPELVILRVKRE